MKFNQETPNQEQNTNNQETARSDRFSSSRQIPSHIFNHHYQEWLDSGISPEIIELNLKSADGYEGLDNFLSACEFSEKERLNSGRLNSSILQKYDHLCQGYWYICSFNPLEVKEKNAEDIFDKAKDAKGEKQSNKTNELSNEEIDNQESVIPKSKKAVTHQSPHQPISESPLFELTQAKPDKPRRYVDNGKEKVIKYEAPKGKGTPFIFLNIPYSIIKKVARKYKIKDLPENTISAKWEWIKNHTEIPIAITEGVKKAAALIGIGIIAVASFSITTHSQKATENCSSWFTELKPELKWLLEKGSREIFIVFDRSDTKLESKLAVNKQTRTLGKKLTKLGHKVKVVDWGDRECKGIDDYLVKHSIKGTNKLFKKAVPYYKFVARVRALATRKLSNAIQVNTPYFSPELIKIGVDSQKKIIGIKSPQNTGKTTATSTYFKKYAKNQSILNITHRQSLSGNLSNVLDIGCYLKEIVQMYEISPDKKYSSSICIDSLLKLSERNVYNCVYFDEVEQCLWHLFHSNTEIQERRGDIIEHLITLVRNCLDNGGTLILSDADLSDFSVNFFAKLLNVRTDEILCYENKYKPFTNRDLIISENIADLRKEIELAIKNGQRIIISTSGQKIISTHGTINLEEWLLEFVPEDKIYRIDQKTNEDPERKEFEIIKNLSKLKKAQIILHSNTISTGVSLTIDLIGKIDKVFGIYWGNYPLDDFGQSLERYRGDCPRHIFLPNFSNSKIGTGSASQEKLMKHFNRKIDMSKPIIDTDEFVFNSQLIAHYCLFASRINGDYKNLKSNFIVHCEEKGYNIIHYEQLDKEERKMINKKAKEVKTKSCHNYAQDLYQETNPSRHELEKLKRKKRKTKKERLRETRGVLTEKYGDLSNLFLNNFELFEYFVLADMGNKLYAPLLRRFWLIFGSDCAKEYEQKKAKKKAKYLRQNEELSYFLDVGKLGKNANFTKLMEVLEIDIHDLQLQAEAVSDEEVKHLKDIGKEFGYNSQKYKEYRANIKDRLICVDDLTEWSEAINKNLNKWKLSAETILDIDFGNTLNNRNKDMERLRMILNRLGYDIDYVFRSCDEHDYSIKKRYYRIVDRIPKELEEQILSNWISKMSFEMNAMSQENLDLEVVA